MHAIGKISPIAIHNAQNTIFRIFFVIIIAPLFFKYKVNHNLCKSFYNCFHSVTVEVHSKSSKKYFFKFLDLEFTPGVKLNTDRYIPQKASMNICFYIFYLRIPSQLYIENHVIIAMRKEVMLFET